MTAHYLLKLKLDLDLKKLPRAVLEVPVTAQIEITVDGMTIVCDSTESAAEFAMALLREEAARRDAATPHSDVTRGDPS